LFCLNLCHDGLVFCELPVIVFAPALRRNFLVASAVSPPVEAEPATKKVIVAIHAGHMGVFFLVGCPFLQATNRTYPIRTKIVRIQELQNTRNPMLLELLTPDS
jgi:hypothetical protein